MSSKKVLIRKGHQVPNKPNTPSDFFKIRVAPDSADFIIFQTIVLESETFTLSQFGYSRYYNMTVYNYFNFHRSEISTLVNKLEQVSDPYYRVAGWLYDIEKYLSLK